MSQNIDNFSDNEQPELRIPAIRRNRYSSGIAVVGQHSIIPMKNQEILKASWASGEVSTIMKVRALPGFGSHCVRICDLGECRGE